MMIARCTALTVVVAALTLPLGAQAPAQAQADSGAVLAATLPAARQSWTSDRRPLRVGDILTIVVDERALATERASDVARADRNQRATLDAEMAPEDLQSLGIGLSSNSDNTGRRERSGSLIAVVSVRVLTVDETGIATVEGTKLVTIDGRRQELRITGVVRSEDVTQQNTVLSSRIANGEIFYLGKKINPKTGIIGKLLGLLWP